MTNKEFNLSDKIINYHIKGKCIYTKDVKDFISECIKEFYGNDIFENEIRTPIEARDILLEKAGEKLI